MAADRIERMASACAEMSSLFTVYPPNMDGSNSGGALGAIAAREGTMSIMSSPEFPSSSQGTATATTNSSDVNATQSSSGGVERTPSRSRSVSPSDFMPPVQPILKKETHHARESHQSQDTENEKKHVSGTGKPCPVESGAQTSTRTPGTHSGNAIRAPSPSVTSDARPVPVASSVPGMMQFACTVQPGMPHHMFPTPGTVLYEGRPMVFVTSAHGTEMVPLDMLPQTPMASLLPSSSTKDSIAQSADEGVHRSTAVRVHTEANGRGRKKRRRQMLDQSECSAEEAQRNRARAMDRLREKKRMRNQSPLVRYACRKRIAVSFT